MQPPFRGPSNFGVAPQGRSRPVHTEKTNRELEELVEDIRTIREIYSPSVRLLICYRADLEARLGEFWQRITGSAQGLPRLYLTGIDEHSAWDVIKKVLADLSVEMTLGAEEETAKLAFS